MPEKLQNNPAESNPFSDLEILDIIKREVRDAKARNNLSDEEKAAILRKEAKRLAKLKADAEIFNENDPQKKAA